MRAILVREFGGPDVLRLEDVPDPKPGPSEVVVRIRAAGVNPVDTYIRSGPYARKAPLPYIPGSDGAGRRAAAGSAPSSPRQGRDWGSFGPGGPGRALGSAGGRAPTSW